MRDEITNLYPKLAEDPFIIWLSVYFSPVTINDIPLGVILQPVSELLFMW